jgi:hypothetical protein
MIPKKPPSDLIREVAGLPSAEPRTLPDTTERRGSSFLLVLLCSGGFYWLNQRQIIGVCLRAIDPLRYRPTLQVVVRRRL